MSLESGPAQWWHRRGISGHRAASPAAAMAPAVGIDRSDPPRAPGTGRGERCVRLPVAAAAEGTGKPCHRSDKNPRASAAHADFQRPGSGHRSGRAPAAAVRFVAFRGPNGLGGPREYVIAGSAGPGRGGRKTLTLFTVRPTQQPIAGTFGFCWKSL